MKVIQRLMSYGSMITGGECGRTEENNDNLFTRIPSSCITNVLLQGHSFPVPVNIRHCYDHFLAHHFTFIRHSHRGSTGGLEERR
jgi:hypothetical protein